jgi:hypothetical protein
MEQRSSRPAHLPRGCAPGLGKWPGVGVPWSLSVTVSHTTVLSLLSHEGRGSGSAMRCHPGQKAVSPQVSTPEGPPPASRRGASKRGPRRWSRTQEIRWSSTQEIAGVRTHEIVQLYQSPRSSGSLLARRSALGRSGFFSCGCPSTHRASTKWIPIELFR